MPGPGCRRPCVGALPHNRDDASANHVKRYLRSVLAESRIDWVTGAKTLCKVRTHLGRRDIGPTHAFSPLAEVHATDLYLILVTRVVRPRTHLSPILHLARTCFLRPIPSGISHLLYKFCSYYSLRFNFHPDSVKLLSNWLILIFKVLLC